ncbi:MAG: hypothetical protein KGL04_10250 [Elusimicrobia bacterium]|nr:hypothetical protein [Elusimicrobiota bacterium]
MFKTVSTLPAGSVQIAVDQYQDPQGNIWTANTRQIAGYASIEIPGNPGAMERGGTSSGNIIYYVLSTPAAQNPNAPLAPQQAAATRSSIANYKSAQQLIARTPTYDWGAGTRGRDKFFRSMDPVGENTWDSASWADGMLNQPKLMGGLALDEQPKRRNLGDLAAFDILSATEGALQQNAKQFTAAGAFSGLSNLLPKVSIPLPGIISKNAAAVGNVAKSVAAQYESSRRQAAAQGTPAPATDASGAPLDESGGGGGSASPAGSSKVPLIAGGVLGIAALWLLLRR